MHIVPLSTFHALSALSVRVLIVAEALHVAAVVPPTVATPSLAVVADIAKVGIAL